jgi:anaerobic dimethyl sulfoxide reductase subunit B (iron-sulfur subunit)
MSYAFTFDAAFCSGCKACQAACKDKNNLPLGVLWRRVVEVSGGTWQKSGEAWMQTVFAYNLSMACNHCVHPKCAGVCPTGAYVVRGDGIVLLDTEKCMGCGYCAWACPYGAPQYNPQAGHMTKCNFCFDDLEQGLPPACVAACPLRALDYGATATGSGNVLRLWEAPAEAHPYPLPNYSHTEPRLGIKPHAAMSSNEEKSVANVEEIQPGVPSGREEAPLILFTLLIQIAVGGFWAMLWNFPGVWIPAEQKAALLPLLLIGLCLGAGLLASLAHLGTKRTAWRALGNLRKSWLSREILFTGLFGAGWLFTTLERAIWNRSTVEGMALTAVLGLGLVYSMSKVYRLPAVPAWNTWRTNAGFLVSALLLGQAFMGALQTSVQWTGIAGIICPLLVQFLVMPQFSRSLLHRLRIGLMLAAILSIVAGLSLSGAGQTWISFFVFLMIMAEEAVGRVSFFQSRGNSFSSL